MKTAVGESPPGVRILSHPLIFGFATFRRIRSACRQVPQWQPFRAIVLSVACVALEMEKVFKDKDADGKLTLDEFKAEVAKKKKKE